MRSPTLTWEVLCEGVGEEGRRGVSVLFWRKVTVLSHLWVVSLSKIGDRGMVEILRSKIVVY